MVRERDLARLRIFLEEREAADPAEGVGIGPAQRQAVADLQAQAARDVGGRSTRIADEE